MAATSIVEGAALADVEQLVQRCCCLAERARSIAETMEFLLDMDAVPLRGMLAAEPGRGRRGADRLSALAARAGGGAARQGRPAAPAAAEDICPLARGGPTSPLAGDLKILIDDLARLEQCFTVPPAESGA
ncbi:MAG: hypothetical protein NVV74_21620 [Magnetospirillum sp.]|nr:hypothetical protein [Magnetospirillum sp.]